MAKALTILFVGKTVCLASIFHTTKMEAMVLRGRLNDNLDNFDNF